MIKFTHFYPLFWLYRALSQIVHVRKASNKIGAALIQSRFGTTFKFFHIRKILTKFYYSLT